MTIVEIFDTLSTLSVDGERIIIVSDRRPESKQGIEGKIVRFRSGRVSVRDKIADLNQITDLKLSVLAPVKFRSPI